MSRCKHIEYCKTHEFECPSPYCKFSSDENADKVFDILDMYCDLVEAIQKPLQHKVNQIEE